MEDVEGCAAARQVATAVDWPCDVRTLYRDSNLGCAVAVSTAITWFFENVEQGIVLEDDCVPSASFYRFCQELLEHYRAESRIMHIGGANVQYGRRRGPGSYYYSRYPNVWGWASWRRAWHWYDFSLRPSWRLEDTWDTQWQLSIEKAGGLAVVPNTNLVKNIGFRPDATHTTGRERAATLVAQEVSFPLRHPPAVRPDRAADVFTYYVLHRQVRFASLVWIYQLMDWAYSRLKSLKRRLRGIWKSRAAGSGGSATATQSGDRKSTLSHDIKARLRQVRVPFLRVWIHAVLDWRRQRTELARYRRWIDAGQPVPPPPYHKQMTVRRAGSESGIAVLVETGTFEGQMVAAVARDYDRIFTIELDSCLGERAVERFRDSPHITVIQGDSREVLPRILEGLSEPAVFWLDAHFSGDATAGNAEESPIMEELRAISGHSLHGQHIILVDDAREFKGGAYPSLAALELWARQSGYDAFEVQHDIIRIQCSR
jgi:hypothetical protein